MTAYGIEFTPIILALTELVKRWVKKYWSKEIAGDVAILFSLGLSQVFAQVYVAESWDQGLLVGLFIGLSANGLFSLGKHAFKRREVEA